MNLKERIALLSKLKTILNKVVSESEWDGYDLGINQEEYEALKYSIALAKTHNQWFTKESVYEAFNGISSWLSEEQLEQWASNYTFAENPKKIAVIMAGNIPLVGFHDWVAVFLSGHKAIVKLSSDDKILFPALINILKLWYSEIDNWVQFSDQKLPEFDAVIATGSDNSAVYFNSYFGKYPHIIRKNRTSIAVLNGDETKEELAILGKDIFTYFGLGCRNVSKILIPSDFVLDRFFEAIYDFNPIIYHNKYANNYDYNKAVYLMNTLPILDNGFLLLKEDDSLHSPLGVLFYQKYQSKAEVEQYLNENKNQLQVVVGKDFTPFGTAQCPALNDYADGIDTMRFLESLNK